MADAEHILRNLIENIATKYEFVKYNVKVEPVSSGGANYTSKLYCITVTETGKSHLNLFAKIAALSEKKRPPVLSKIYNIERLAYTKLIAIYQSIENEHNIPDKLKILFPEFYDCNPTKYEETIVIENLTAKGYVVYDRFKSINWEFASKAIENLAKWHAVSFSYAVKQPADFNDFLEDIKPIRIDNDQMRMFWAHVVNSAVNETRAENVDKLKRYLDRGKQEVLVKYFKPLRRTAIIHGDYRVSNVMFRTCADGKIEIKIVDLQTLSGGSPVIDLLYFIFTGSDEQFRAAHYHQLLDHYYTQLSLAMRRLQLDPDATYSREDFDYELKEKLPFGLTIAVFTLPIVTVETENAPKVNDDLDIPSMSMMKTSDLYTERLNGVVNDYVKWGILN